MVNQRSILVGIGGAAQKTGLTLRQIRHYEDRGLIVPFRTKGNQRRYNQIHLGRLQKIKDGLEAGYTIDELRDSLERDLALDVDSSGQSDVDVPAAHVMKLRPLDSVYPVRDQERLSRRLKDDQGTRL